MSYLDTIRLALDGFAAIPAPETPTERAQAAAPALGKALAGGRLSFDTADQFLMPGAPYISPPPNAEGAWQALQLDQHTLERMPPFRLMELLADLSPEISRALWDFLRLVNPGWEATAYRPGTTEQDARAQAVLDQSITLAAGGAVDFNVVIGRLFMGAWMRGAFLGELILDAAGRLPVGFGTPDPASVRFQRVSDPVLGWQWQPFQWQAGQRVLLDRPTVLYIPIDPFPASPYGRSPAAPALFASIFLLGMLHDIRRVIQQQGYPRLDIEVTLEELLKIMPKELEYDSVAMNAWITATIAEIQQQFSLLQPDDTYIHTSVVKVNRPVGTADASSLGGIDRLIDVLEGMLTRALKSMPILMGLRSAGRPDALGGTREWEIHVAGIKAIQHSCEVMFQRLFGLALQVQGIAADVQFRFAELRTAELLRDAQVENLISQVAAFQYDRGWLSQDQSAQKGAKVEKADAPEPRTTATPAPGNIVGGTPDPGSTRALATGVERSYQEAGMPFGDTYSGLLRWIASPDDEREQAVTHANGHSNGHAEVAE